MVWVVPVGTFPVRLVPAWVAWPPVPVVAGISMVCLGVLVTLGLIVQRSGMSLWCSSSWWFGFVLGTLGDLGVLGVGVVLVGLLV
jgi:hypothetical protein